MIRQATKYAMNFTIMAAMLAFAGASQAGTAAVSPALAACSKALVETISKEPLPAYTVKPPSAFVSDLVDPHAFTVLAHNKRTNKLLAKASCKATPEGEIVSFKAMPVKS
jgi:hypothetical protein